VRSSPILGAIVFASAVGSVRRVRPALPSRRSAALPQVGTGIRAAPVRGAVLRGRREVPP